LASIKEEDAIEVAGSITDGNAGDSLIATTRETDVGASGSAIDDDLTTELVLGDFGNGTLMTPISGGCNDGGIATTVIKRTRITTTTDTVISEIPAGRIF